MISRTCTSCFRGPRSVFLTNAPAFLRSLLLSCCSTHLSLSKTMKSGDLDAYIEIDGQRVEEYALSHEREGFMSCCIPSEEGKVRSHTGRTKHRIRPCLTKNTAEVRNML